MENNTVSEILVRRQQLVDRLSEFEEIKKDIAAMDRVLKIMGIAIEAQIEDKPLTAIDKIGMSIGETISIINEPAALTKVNPPKEYSPALTWEDKCLFVLGRFGALYANEVAKKVVEIDPKINIELAEERAAYNLSKLKIANKIKVVDKTGRKFKYSI